MRAQCTAVVLMLATAACGNNNGGGKKDASVDLAPAASVDLAKPATNPDMGPDGGSTGGIKGHPGMAVMSGGVSAKSTNYKVIMSLGQAPGDNKSTSSTNNKLKSGVVGATQGGNR